MSSVVASIGTTHPWNVAGLGMDVQVARAFGVRNLSVVVAVSAQDAQGMHALEPVSAQMLDAQLASLPVSEIKAVRVGALAGAPAVKRVAAFLRAHQTIPAVVDPVFGATLGGTFLDDEGFVAFRDALAVLPSVILTPNAEEAARLTGETAVDEANIATVAQALLARGVRAVLVKGGHLPGDPVDALATGKGVEVFVDERLPGTMRGTGCVLAMTIACELARGLPLHDAVQSARTYVRSRIVGAAPFAGISAAY
jgi:hydroxymethylpyrimidine/phosphomethylpyrimidine kinase